jgi:D-inositol-3-phosphate glycosyltransferase
MGGGRQGRALADARLVVVGGPSGPHGVEEQQHAAELVGTLGLEDRVDFVAPQPHELLSSYYRAADVVVIPSRSESFGLVALEASACGIPVVAAAVGGLSTLVDDGDNGFLVEGRDPARYAERLAAVLGRPGLAEAMGRSGAERARRYTWSVAAARLRRLYADLTSRQLVECR